MAQAAYSEYHVPRDGHVLYAHSYAGANPALVLMHGFPDNLHIYDALAPLLAAAGRRTVVFDFLGYGASDKPADYPYSTEGLEHDLQAVVDVLDLTAIVPVAHDASGPTAINWALDHPERVAALALLNTYYDEAPTLRFPELISLFSDPHYADLAAALAGAPAQLGWVLAFQGRQMYRQVSAPIREARERNPVILPIVQAQFAAQPSVMPAFMRLTRELRASVQVNTMRRAELASLDVPVRLIWGADDPYLNRGVAEHFETLLPSVESSLLPLGHWPQVDDPGAVAGRLLELPMHIRTRLTGEK